MRWLSPLPMRSVRQFHSLPSPTADEAILVKNPWLAANTGRIQKVFGVIMILTAIAIYFQIDRSFQSYILDTFPSYGVGLTKFEDNTIVKNALKQLQDPSKRKEQSMVNKLFESDLGNAPELITGGKWFNLPTGSEIFEYEKSSRTSSTHRLLDIYVHQLYSNTSLPQIVA